jgi:hypothetical protein
MLQHTDVIKNNNIILKNDLKSNACEIAQEEIIKIW